MFHCPEKYRIGGSGNSGAFRCWSAKCPRKLTVVAGGDEEGWEHVSVSLPDRTPTWREMCFIKSLFWDPEDIVVQIHPRASEYVNAHPNCLHLWRPIGWDILQPPVGIIAR